MPWIEAYDLSEQQRTLVRLIVNDGKKLEEAADLAGYHPKYRFIRQCDCQRSRLRSRNRYSLTLQS
ncbi:hypothetical protein ABID62_009408 [Bradyrhizobium sp. S3.9.1]|jgi:hypothetical protein